METPTTLEELREARLQGADPYKILLQVAKQVGAAKGHLYEREALKRSTVGASPWILSAWLLSQS